MHSNKRVLGYDFHPTEGHHRHYLKEGKIVREKCEFKSIEDTLKRFNKDVEEFEKEEYKK